MKKRKINNILELIHKLIEKIGIDEYKKNDEGRKERSSSNEIHEKNGSQRTYSNYDNNNETSLNGLMEKVCELSDKYNTLRRDFDNIKTQFEDLKKLCSNLKTSKKEEKRIESKINTDTKYFGTVIIPEGDKSYIYEILDDDSQQEAVFKLEITGDTGKFKPLLLKCIKWDYIPSRLMVISDDTNNRTKSTDYQVVEEGLCHKEGDKWFVDKPVKIKFIEK